MEKKPGGGVDSGVEGSRQRAVTLKVGETPKYLAASEHSPTKSSSPFLQCHGLIRHLPLVSEGIVMVASWIPHREPRSSSFGRQIRREG